MHIPTRENNILNKSGFSNVKSALKLSYLTTGAIDAFVDTGLFVVGLEIEPYKAFFVCYAVATVMSKLISLKKKKTEM